MSNTYTEILSNLASIPKNSKGRFFKEKEDKKRSCYQRDRDRVIHSGAFRKLEYKTQVFVNYEGDYYRTRLTHSLEVAQIARSLCRRLGLNEDLAEAISLAHDLGHTPFGHAGEEGLNISTENYIGFDHNVQSLRILILLEQRYAEFDGMNMTWEMLEGIAKHNGPLIGPCCTKPQNNKFMLEYNEKYNLKLDEFSSAEAQISSISDDIAYNSHDLDDGLRANLFTIEELFDLPVIGNIFKDITTKYPSLQKGRVVHESLRKVVSLMVEDIVSQIKNNIKQNNIVDQEDIRKLGKTLVHFSPEIDECNKKLQSFLREKVYRHYKVNRMTSKAKRIVQELFEFFHKEPISLPSEWGQIASKQDPIQRSVTVCDFIAGMTDRFAIQEHRRIFDTSYEMTSF